MRRRSRAVPDLTADQRAKMKRYAEWNDHMSDLWTEHEYLIRNGLLDPDQPTQFAHENGRKIRYAKRGAGG